MRHVVETSESNWPFRGHRRQAYFIQWKLVPCIHFLQTKSLFSQTVLSARLFELPRTP